MLFDVASDPELIGVSNLTRGDKQMIGVPAAEEEGSSNSAKVSTIAFEQYCCCTTEAIPAEAVKTDVGVISARARNSVAGLGASGTRTAGKSLNFSGQDLEVIV